MKPEQIREQRKEKKHIEDIIDAYIILHAKSLASKDRIKLMELHRYYFWKYKEEYKGQVLRNSVLDSK